MPHAVRGSVAYGGDGACIRGATGDGGRGARRRHLTGARAGDDAGVQGFAGGRVPQRRRTAGRGREGLGRAALCETGEATVRRVRR